MKVGNEELKEQVEKTIINKAILCLGTLGLVYDEWEKKLRGNASGEITPKYIRELLSNKITSTTKNQSLAKSSIFSPQEFSRSILGPLKHHGYIFYYIEEKKDEKKESTLIGGEIVLTPKAIHLKIDLKNQMPSYCKVDNPLTATWKTMTKALAIFRDMLDKSDTVTSAEDEITEQIIGNYLKEKQMFITKKGKEKIKLVIVIFSHILWEKKVAGKIMDIFMLTSKGEISIKLGFKREIYLEIQRKWGTAKPASQKAVVEFHNEGYIEIKAKSFGDIMEVINCISQIL